MVTRREKQQREERAVSAKRRVETKDDGGRTCLNLPSGLDLFSVKSADKTKRIDIIPYRLKDNRRNPFAKEMEKGDLYFERTYFCHRGIGPEQNSYVCSRKTFNKPCFVCEYRAKLARKPDADEEEIKDLAPKERQLWLVFDHADAEKGVQLWDVSFHLFGKQLDARIRGDAADEESEGYDLFADPKKGSTLKVGFEEKSYNGTKFYPADSIDFKPRKEPLDSELLEAAPCLDDLPREMDYEKLKKEFLQAPEEDDEDEEDEDKNEAPSRNGRKSKAEEDADSAFAVGGKVEHSEHGVCTVLHISGDGTSLKLKDEEGTIHKACDPEDCDLIDGDDEDEDDEDEEETPKKPRKKPARSADEDKEVDEEEEEVPTKGGKKAAKVEEDDDWEDEDEESEEALEDEDEDDEGEEEEPVKKPAKKPGRK
jgi:hypothetical protein